MLLTLSSILFLPCSLGKNLYIFASPVLYLLITDIKTVLFLYWIINTIYIFYPNLWKFLHQLIFLWNFFFQRFFSDFMNMLSFHAFIRNNFTSAMPLIHIHFFYMSQRKNSIEKSNLCFLSSLFPILHYFHSLLPKLQQFTDFYKFQLWNTVCFFICPFTVSILD